MCVLRVFSGNLSPQEAARLAELSGEVSLWNTGDGFNFDVSDADEDFAQQVTDASSFLEDHRDGLKLLGNRLGAKLSLDFICFFREGMASSTAVLPAELCRLAGEVGCEVTVSNYLTNDS